MSGWYSAIPGWEKSAAGITRPLSASNRPASSRRSRARARVARYRGTARHRETESAPSARHLDLGEVVVADGRQPRDDGLDELLGRRGTRGEPDRGVTVEQAPIQIALAVDQRRGGALEARDFDEPLRVRARLRADHEDQRRTLRDHFLDRVLAVLCRVADVVRGGTLQVTEAIGERVDGRGDVVERERRLRDHRDRLAARIEPLGVLGRLDHDRGIRPLAARPDYLDVVGMSDERDDMAAVGIAPRLRVNLRDERADRVDDPETAPLGVLLHPGRDAVRREHADLPGRNLVLVLDEDRAERLEPPDDVLVVDDLVASVH